MIEDDEADDEAIDIASCQSCLSLFFTVCMCIQVYELLYISLILSLFSLFFLFFLYCSKHYNHVSTLFFLLYGALILSLIFILYIYLLILYD